MKKICYIIAILTLLAGCAPEPQQPGSLVLEGWIDANGYPVVLIHRSLVFANMPDSVRKLEDMVEDLLIPFGKVTVSDGVEEVILTGRLDTAYMPPYTYSSINMVGQVGKTYKVTAKYNDLYAEASTTIPPVAHLDSLSVRFDSVGLGTVRGYMSGVDNPYDSYYVLFVREQGKKQFQFCPLGVFEGREAVNGRIEMVVSYSQKQDIKGRNDYCFYRDSVQYQLKLARVDYASYQFWQAYSQQQLTSGLVFVTVYRNVPSNVEGGLGYFSGMGSSVYTFDTTRDTTYYY